MNANTQKSPYRLVAAALAATAMTLGVAAQAQMTQGSPSQPMTHQQGAMQKSGDMMAGHDHGSTMMDQTMHKGMESMQQMKMSGDVDKDFAMMMKMHHQQALEMAKVEIEHGKSAPLKAMAKKMIKDQTKEIGQLDQWMKSHPYPWQFRSGRCFMSGTVRQLGSAACAGYGSDRSGSIFDPGHSKVISMPVMKCSGALLWLQSSMLKYAPILAVGRWIRAIHFEQQIQPVHGMQIPNRERVQGCQANAGSCQQVSERRAPWRCLSSFDLTAWRPHDPFTRTHRQR